MTEKQQKFKNFKDSFLDLAGQIEQYDISSVTDIEIVQKIAKLQETAKYIKNFFNIIEPDFLPEDFYSQQPPKWNNGFNANENIKYTVNGSLANVLDFYLKRIALYANIYIPKNQISPAINEIISTYEQAIRQSLEKINLDEYEENSKLIAEYKNQLLESEDCIKSRIEISESQIKEWYSNIKALNDEIFVNENNMKNRIEQGETELKNFISKKGELDDFYKKIFGEDDKIGLKDEFEDRIKQFNDFEIQQKQTLGNLLEEAKKLLNHSTNVSLASAFAKAKENFETNIYFWNTIFVIVISAFVVVAIFTLLDAKEILSAGDYKKAAITLLGNLFLYIPLSWLALFASRRRNENRKLLEEYRYKETIAKSFLGYKEQIKELSSDEENNLDVQLMQNLLNMLSDNPNKALENQAKNSKESMPVMEVLTQATELVKNARK